MGGISVLSTALWRSGPWPLVAYTVWSWKLMTMRYLVGSLIPAESTAAVKQDAETGWRGALQSCLVHVHESLRFPSLVQNSVTVVLWWLALVPLAAANLGREQRARFFQFNRSFILVNFHGLTLPLAAADHLLCPRRLCPLDLWLGLAWSAMYLAFYYSVMDPRGLHLYIFLSPHTKWCVVPFAAIMSFY